MNKMDDIEKLSAKLQSMDKPPLPPKQQLSKDKKKPRVKKEKMNSENHQQQQQQQLSHDVEEYHRDLMFLKMEFSQNFQSCYRRNNKAGGVKNVRCFPRCSSVHSHQGFCGQPVLAKIIVIRKSNEMSAMNMTIVGEFQPLGKEFKGIKSGINDSEIMRNSICASPKYIIPHKRILFSEQRRGFVHEEVELCFEARPWQYNWPANKHKVETLHSFFINVLIPKAEYVNMSNSGPPAGNLLVKASELVLLQRFQSPSFTIKSVRKSGGVVIPPQAEINAEEGTTSGYVASISTKAAAEVIKSYKRKRVPTVTAEAVSITDSSSSSAAEWNSYSTDSTESDDPTQLDLIEEEQDDIILGEEAPEDDNEGRMNTDDINESMPLEEHCEIHPSILSPPKSLSQFRCPMPPMPVTFKEDEGRFCNNSSRYPKTLDSEFFQQAVYSSYVAVDSSGMEEETNNGDPGANAIHQRMLHSLFPGLYA